MPFSRTLAEGTVPFHRGYASSVTADLPHREDVLHDHFRTAHHTGREVEAVRGHRSRRRGTALVVAGRSRRPWAAGRVGQVEIGRCRPIGLARSSRGEASAGGSRHGAGCSREVDHDVPNRRSSLAAEGRRGGSLEEGASESGTEQGAPVAPVDMLTKQESANRDIVMLTSAVHWTV